MTKTAFILNFFKLYNMLWRIGLPFLKKNRRLRQGFQKRVTSLHHSKADIWIQAASAGEAYLAVTLLKRLLPKTK
ncbi:MAG: 3-deoxy-D-manno-octulosonic acid transferase, partial [Proteobacteria bacterium]|nr:3-deoxy-D-manno-octulosonic acid transferase [Pseudomonadota bacterium]